MHARSKWIVGLMVVAAMVAAGGWWLQQMKAKNAAKIDRNRPVPVLIGQVRLGDAPVTITALGTVTARQQATVRPRVDGLLLAVDFSEGTVVKAGDTLARIDPRPFEAALAVAQGQLEKDLAQLEIARTDVQRYKKLLAEDSIAGQQVDAQIALVKQLEGTVAADRGAVATARLNLSFTAITAPIAGRTGLRQVDPGNMVRASDTTGLVVLMEVQPITVVFAVPQEDLPEVMARFRDRKARGEIPAEALDRDGRTVLEKGRVLAIDNQTDPTTGSTKIKAQFDNQANRLYPGQFVNVRLLVDTLKAVLLVPPSAVQRGTQGAFVYVVSDDKTASVRPVQLGPASDERIVIASGLTSGETVVIDGADKLRDGSLVTAVVPPPSSPRKQEVQPPEPGSSTPSPPAPKAGQGPAAQP